MKLQEQYKNLKKEYKKFVILQKKGIFYMAYQDDALILNYLFNYQVKDDAAGFPEITLGKVLEELKYRQINIYILNDSDEIYEYDDNTYDDVLYYAKKNYFENLNSRLLLEEIEFLLKNKPENLRKLKDFVSEL